MSSDIKTNDNQAAAPATATATAVSELSDDEKQHYVDLTDSNVIDKYRIAGDIVNNAIKHVISKTQTNASVLDLCSEGDKYIEEATAKIFNQKQKDGSMIQKGVAFPTCININQIVGHYSPLKTDNKNTVKDGDVVKIDLGVHIDGYVVTGAHTIVVGNDSSKKVTGRTGDALSAAHQAAQAALRLLRPGSVNSQISEVIQAVAKDYGVTPVAGVLSHQMNRYQIDGKELISQRPVETSIEGKQEKVPEYSIKSNEIWALDIVMSTGEGKPRPSAEHPTTIYSKQDTSQYAVKGKITKEIMNVVDKKYIHFPFTMRSLSDKEANVKFAIREMREHNVVEEYVVLTEPRNEIVTHVKYTVMIRTNQTDRLSGMDIDLSNVETDKKVTSDNAVKALAMELPTKKKKEKKQATPSISTSGAASNAADAVKSPLGDAKSPGYVKLEVNRIEKITSPK